MDKAIRDYEALTGDRGVSKIPLPRFIEKAPDSSEAQRLLGGEMRLCSPWVDDCPKD